MPLRLAASAVVAGSLCLGSAALAREPAKAAPAAAKPAQPVTKPAQPVSKPAQPAAKPAQPAAKTPAPAARSPAKPSFEAREPAGGATPGKQRQKTCIAEWQALSAAEKTAQGPGWPKFYSKCVKRLKGAQKE